MKCGLCGIEKEKHETVNFHGIIHLWTEPYEAQLDPRQGYNFVVDYLPLAFVFLVVLFFVAVFAN